MILDGTGIHWTLAGVTLKLHCESQNSPFIIFLTNKQYGKQYGNYTKCGICWNSMRGLQICYILSHFKKLKYIKTH